MKGRIGLRITSSILFIFSFILFLSGCLLQRRSMQTLERYYDTIPLPETHPLAIEKKRRKAALSGVPAPTSYAKAAGHGGNQRVLLSSPPQRQDVPTDHGVDGTTKHAVKGDTEKFKSVGYVQVVTDYTSVCSAVLAFNDLDRLSSKASRILIYPESWDMQLDISESQQKEAQRILAVQEKTLNHKRKGRKGKKTDEGLANHEETNPLDPPQLIRQPPGGVSSQYHTARRLLHLARIKHSVTLLPIPDEMVTPLVMLNMTDYKRLLYLRHPAAIMKNMDEMLLHSPKAVVAATRDLDGRISNNFLIMAPESGELEYVIKQGGLTTDVGKVVEKMYATTAMMLPRWPYEIHTSEFFNPAGEPRTDRTRASTWSPSKVLLESHYILFNGSKKTQLGEWEEVPQPWKLKSLEEDAAPKCHPFKEENGVERWDCTARNVWRTLYDGYRQRRMEVCGLDLEA